MFDPSFFNFDFFGFALMASVVIAPLFGEWHNWLPDFGEWLTPELEWIKEKITDAANLIVNGIKGFIGTIIEVIKSVYETFIKWCNYVWDFVKAFFEYVKDAITGLFTWLGETLSTFYEWLGDCLSDLWGFISETVTNFCDWCIETVVYFAECIFEYFLQFLDWFVGVMVEMFKWLLDKLPAIELPEGFQSGVNYFIEYGMILDKILPIKEAFGLFAIYVGILLILTIYRFVKSWIPFF